MSGWKKSKRALMVEPIAGLANRMRVLASAIAVHKEFGAERVECLWFENRDLGAPFERLFEPMEQVRTVSRPKRITAGLNPRYTAAVRNFFRGVDLALYNDTFVRKINPLGLSVEALMRDSRRVYIQSCYAFVDRQRLGRALRLFRPTRELRAQIERYRIEFQENRMRQEGGGRIVGLHVRRTDHAHAIAHSPLAGFVEAMRREVGRYGTGVRFFLSTDDLEAERQLRLIFPDRITVHPKVYDRHCVRGVQDALVDLYTLAGTDKIYGSYGSSFSEIAALIGEIPLEIAVSS